MKEEMMANTFSFRLLMKERSKDMNRSNEMMMQYNRGKT